MIPDPKNVAERNIELGLSPPQPSGERWRHFLGLLRTFWAGPDWIFAWSASILLLSVELGGVYIMVWTNEWQQRFFDAVQFKQAGLFATLVVSFCIVTVAGVGTGLLAQYLYGMLAFRWRAALTDRFMNRWFGRHRYYEIERTRVIDNPDQRISEDLNLFTIGVLPLFFGSITATTQTIAFAMILLRTADPIDLDLLGWRVSVPGDTLWYTLLYALAGAIAVVIAGRPFIRRTMRQQHFEANFRFGLIHVRRNAEQIAFAASATTEKRSLMLAFMNIRQNFVRLIYAQLGLRGAQGIYGSLGTMMPLFIALPKYFAGRLTFGQVMASRDAFAQMLSSLSYFTQAYQTIAEQIANANRIKALDDVMDLTRPGGIEVVSGETGAMIARDLRVNTPDGRPLVDIGDWTVAPGERWIVQGASGGGKSTLMRAIAGLWPDGAGRIELPRDATTMFVPQRLYLPLGSLKEAVTFPDTPDDHADEVIRDLLMQVGLGAHVGGMHNVKVWQDDLSPGEQQRVALARILLHRPERLVLDEATSALDGNNAVFFYRTVVEALPDLTLVSVVHADNLSCFHNRSLTVIDGKAVQGIPNAS